MLLLGFDLIPFVSQRLNVLHLLLKFLRRSSQRGDRQQNLILQIYFGCLACALESDDAVNRTAVFVVEWLLYTVQFYLHSPSNNLYITKLG